MIRMAVIGLGRAGQARLRALDGHPHARCVATVSRRAGESLGPTLARDDVDAVLVCTENAAHATQARAGLSAGKHVAVEFPLAPTAGDCRALYAVAAQHRVVLHTELIGQLTGRFRALVAQRGALTGVHARFAGGFTGWIADEAAAGRHAGLATSRLHALWTLAGPLSLDDAALTTFDDGYRLEVALTGRVPATLVEERRAGVARRNTLDALGPDGPLGPEPLPTPPLFRADLDAFVHRIRVGGEGYVPDEQVVAVAALCDAIRARVGSAAG